MSGEKDFKMQRGGAVTLHPFTIYKEMSGQFVYNNGYYYIFIL